MKKTYSSKNTKSYCNHVIRILKEFHILLSDEQKQTMYKLPTEEAVDRYKHELIQEAFQNA